MTGIATTAALILVAVGAVAAWVGTVEMRRVKLARFAGRRPLDGSEFFETYYRGSGLDMDRVILVQRLVARAIEVPADLLRPADRFDAELAPASGWEYRWDDGLRAMQEAGLVVGGELHRPDWKVVATLDDLIRSVSRPSHA